MEQVLRERGILTQMEAKYKSGFVPGVCKDCAMSEVKRDKARKAAKTREDEIDGSGMEGLADHSEVESESEDLTLARDCCMQRVLSFQAYFLAEKPLLQLVIEKAGHKCLFLPKFHCELNPIEMV